MARENRTMSLDSRGRVSKLNRGGTSKSARNAWRRKSNGGAGG